MAKRRKIWTAAPEAEDYAAARHYLALLCSPEIAGKLTQAMRRQPAVVYAAKDLLRASGLDLLSRSESHVQSDLKRLKKGKRLSPVLLLRGNIAAGHPLVVVDGYHRLCAGYYYDEDLPVACRIAQL